MTEVLLRWRVHRVTTVTRAWLSGVRSWHRVSRPCVFFHALKIQVYGQRKNELTILGLSTWRGNPHGISTAEADADKTDLRKVMDRNGGERMAKSCERCEHVVHCKARGKKEAWYCWHPSVRGKHGGLGFRLWCPLAVHPDCPMRKADGKA